VMIGVRELGASCAMALFAFGYPHMHCLTPWSDDPGAATSSARRSKG
jgi:hypothetical protein